MTNENESIQNLFTEYSDKETEDFFSSGGETELHDESNESGDTHEENPQENKIENNSETNQDESSDANREEDKGNDGESEDAQKAETDSERLRAMAAEERIKRKEVQKQIEQLTKENEQLRNTFTQIVSSSQKDAKEQAPSFEDDPIGALKHENEQLKKQFSELSNFRDQTIQERDLSRKEQMFMQSYRGHVQEFTQSNPDFHDAYQFLLQNRKAEYEMAGYSENDVNQLLHEDEAAIVANAMKNERNPAETIYQLAKLRGYAVKANQKNHESDKQTKIKENEKKIHNLERGMAASRSINAAGGSNARNNLTLEDVADMSEDEIGSVDWEQLMRSG